MEFSKGIAVVRIQKSDLKIILKLMQEAYNNEMSSCSSTVADLVEQMGPVVKTIKERYKIK